MMTEALGLILVVAFVAVIAIDLLGDSLMHGIGVRVLRRFSGSGWPAEESTWRSWIAAVVVGWAVVISAMMLIWLAVEVVT